MFELNKKLNLLLTDFLIKFSYFICSEGMPYVLSKSYHELWLNFVDEYGDRGKVGRTGSKRSLSKTNGLDFYTIHNNGAINDFLAVADKSDIVDSDLEKYFNDTEHGFFHGLMTCFVSYIIIHGERENITTADSSRKGYGNKKLEKLIPSCLLHDFLRIDDKYDKHDQQLKEFFPLLDDVVYNHSNPNANQVNHEIIKADRLELRRYKDHLEWLSDTSTVYPQKLHANRYNPIGEGEGYLLNEQIDMINLFYDKVRPALEYVFMHRDKTWFTHVGEIREKLIYENGISFPNLESYLQPSNMEIKHGHSDHWYPSNSIFKKSEYKTPPYAVYEERFPFFKLRKSYHDGCVKGVIESGGFKDLGGEVKFSGVRDHPYLVSDIPLEDWTFFFNSTSKVKNEIDIKLLLQSNAKGLIAIENIHLFSECYEDFKKRMCTLTHI